MQRSFETIHVREIMTHTPVSVRADDSLQRALDLSVRSTFTQNSSTGRMSR